MELGSIHPDEQSARRAVAMLIKAGIEPQRVRVVRPKTMKPSDAPEAPVGAGFDARARDIAGGVGFGAASAVLAAVVLAIARVHFFEMDPLGVSIALAALGTVLGGAVAALTHWRNPSLASIAPARPRPRAKGWAVVVHTRDIEQRALAAAALARAARQEAA